MGMYKGKPGAAPKNSKAKQWSETPQPKIPASGGNVVKAAQAVVGNTSGTEKQGEMTVKKG